MRTTLNARNLEVLGAERSVAGYRYGINQFRYRRMHRQTLIVKAPRSSVEQVLWLEFQELSAALTAYLADITDRLIREEVHRGTADVEERDEPRRLGR